MASSYTDRLRLEKQGAGENDDTWGAKLNTVIDLVDEAVDGYLAKSVAGASDVTLTSTNGASDESRQRSLKFTGTLTGNINVIVPAVEKYYVVWNATSGAFTLTFKPSGGTGIVVPQGFIGVVFTDGSTMYQAAPWIKSTGSGGPLRTVYTSSDTWTKPAGLVRLLVQVQAAGGGGGGSAATSAGEGANAAGGGGGEYREGWFAASALGSSETVTIGAAGTGGAVAGTGGNASNSSFGAHVVAVGGSGGAAGTASSSSPGFAGGAGGTGGSGGSLSIPGQRGGATKLVGGVFVPTGNGGDSQLGRGARAPINSTGVAAGNYGGGGSGANASSSESARTGGAGGGGVIIVTEFYN